MQAIVVRPGDPGFIESREVPRPTLDQGPGTSGVLVRVLRVGICGTDEEIIAGEFGTAPGGDDYLILGHESLGEVVEGAAETLDDLAPGSLVVASVRRPGSSKYDRIGMQDFTTDAVAFERGINQLHGFLAEFYMEDAAYLIPLPGELREVGVLLEPLSIIEKGLQQAVEIQRRLRIWQPERALVTGAGTIGLLTALALRMQNVEVTVLSRRKAPYLNGDLVDAIGARYLSIDDADPAHAAEEHGPFDLIVEASGSSPLALDAAQALGPNGVLVLTGVTAGEQNVEIDANALNQGFVLGNKVMVGTVNASRDDFIRGVGDMVAAEGMYPGWLGRLLTTPIRGLEDAAAIMASFEDDDVIKAFVEVGSPG
jgi:glucose 1-dehydrogenase